MDSEHELCCLADMCASPDSATDLVTFDTYLSLSLFPYKKNSFCLFIEHIEVSINIDPIIYHSVNAYWSVESRKDT